VLLRIDPGSATPLFDQLAGGIRSAAIRGSIQPGERLPSARELAESLEMNVHTVLRAYQLLRDEGLVDLRRGRGAVVTGKAADYAGLSSAIATVVDEAKRIGLDPAAVTALVREAFQ
jgi:GntR family transcriptional regulator